MKKGFMSGGLMLALILCGSFAMADRHDASYPVYGDQISSYFKTQDHVYQVMSRMEIHDGLWDGELYSLIKTNFNILRSKYCFEYFKMNRLNSMRHGDYILYFHEDIEDFDGRGRKDSYNRQGDYDNWQREGTDDYQYLFVGPPEPSPTPRPFPFLKFINQGEGTSSTLLSVHPRALQKRLRSKSLGLCVARDVHKD